MKGSQLKNFAMKKDVHNYIKARNREKAREQGFYDGRFRSRVVADKKKKASARKCRGHYNITIED